MRSRSLSAFGCLFLSIAFSLLLSACSSQKETRAGRLLQNLTAHYNILYNARELITASEKNINGSIRENYDLLIPVFKEPDEESARAELKSLDDAILKCNVIANEKSQSNYVDDAYFLIGKANHLKANFYNAIEFFTYVYNSYPDEVELRQASLVWKARSLMQAERFEEAERTLDTAFKYISTDKKSAAEIYAARAQLHLFAQEDKDAIANLEKAVDQARDAQLKVRWTYILAQLYQINGNDEEAYARYAEVEKSNAPFEMSFNASLNRLSLREQLTGQTIDRAAHLRAMLKDDKNRDFVDQIYYEIANSYLAKDNLENAIANYRQSVRASSANSTQKGLSYLKLAEVYFKDGDFIQSKGYYDSTLIALPKTHPEYTLISKRASSLEYLAERLQTIAREDTLQMLASLPEADRELRIGALVREQALKTISGVSTSNLDIGASTQASPGTRNEKFYFNNSTALAQGRADFARRWGNRNLEDGWRISQRTASAPAPIDQQTVANIADINIPDPSPANVEAIRKTFIEGMPLSPELRLASDQRIATAYFEIGNYYRDVLQDTLEAISTFETLLKRFPDDEHNLAAYYNLYRLYSSSNPARSKEYSDIIRAKFPDSPFARALEDPGYNQRIDEMESAYFDFYNRAYDLYTERKYPEALAHVNRYGETFTGRPMPAQLDYLRALSIGRTQKLDQLEKAFAELVSAYSEDKLILPIVRQHQQFINENRAKMAARPYAIMDTDPNEIPYFEEPANAPVNPVDVQIAQAPVPVTSQPQERKDKEPAPVENIPNTIAPAATSPAGPASFFEKEENAIFYLVVSVANPSVNLNSSRFGIGQFNRINFPGAGLRHQLKRVESNQLIFVGPFEGREMAQKYLNDIDPMMKDIMKVPTGSYNTFFINQQNLDRITSSDLLERYIGFYRSTYF